MHHVLIVEDDPAVRAYLAQILEDDGITTVQASSGEIALPLLEGAGAVLLDLVLLGMSGEAMLAEMHRLGYSLPVVVCTGYHRPELRAASEALGIVYWIEKPPRRGELLRAVRAALSANDSLRSMGKSTERLRAVQATYRAALDATPEENQNPGLI